MLDPAVFDARAVVSVERSLPQRAQRTVYDQIRIEVQYPVEFRQQFRQQEPVIGVVCDIADVEPQLFQGAVFDDYEREPVAVAVTPDRLFK